MGTMPSSPSILRAAALMCCFLALLGAGCSSSAPKATSATTTTESNGALADSIGKQLVQAKLLDPTSAQCVGGHLAPQLSAKGKSISQAGIEAVTSLSSADRAVLESSLDACVTAPQLAKVIASGVASAPSGGSTPISDCVEAKLTQQYSSSGQMLLALFDQSGQAVVASMLSSCGVPGLAPSTTTG